ncbi:hypothetical protein BH11PAT2_BH11PAT2_05380 [soil metagenome]
MKKALAIALVLVLFLGLLAAILFKVFAPSKPSTAVVPVVQFPVATAPVGVTNQNPVQFVESFYTWYLQNFYRDPFFPHPENRNEVLSPWLTSDFLAGWDQVVSDIEVNPVLLTADDPSSWGSAISARIASQSIRTSVVYLTIGTGTSLHAYNVSLVQTTDGNWKISDIASTI